MLLKIRLHPGAKKNETAGTLADGTIKINLTAPPIDGRANKALIEYLAREYGVPKARITLKSGQKSRLKLVEIL
jgi:hypothetical protein